MKWDSEQKTARKRFERLCPDGAPRWWRFYAEDGGEGWLCVMTGSDADGFYRSCSRDPYHPQGIGSAGQYDRGPVDLRDRRTAPKIGRRSSSGLRVGFAELPPKVQKSVLEDERSRRGWAEQDATARVFPVVAGGAVVGFRLRWSDLNK